VLAHTLRLSLRALRQDLLRSLLMIVALGLGIGAAMTSVAVFRAMSVNPLAHKEGRVFIVQMDNMAAGSPYQKAGEPPKQLTYRDATALWQTHQARRQVLLYPNQIALEGLDAPLSPTLATVMFTTADLFPMFDVPMRYGGGWDAATDERGDLVVVLSRELNERAFGGANSVGKHLRIGGQRFTVIGVTEAWHPQPRFYDYAAGVGAPEPDLWLPFAFGIAQQMRALNNDCWPSYAGPFAGFQQSECVWLNLWVELGSPDEVAAYRTLMERYVADQKALGRFPQPMHNRLRTVAEWLRSQAAVSSDVRLQTLLSFAFLAVCLINTAGLLLAKFLARVREVSVHRALGATRNQIFLRYLAEAGVIGLCGSLIGLLLTFGGSAAMQRLAPDLAHARLLDPSMIGATVVLAIAVSLVAGAIPAWRVCRTVPATFLKSE